MKKILLLFVIALSMTQLFAQNSSKSAAKEDRSFRIPLIGEQAPSFTAETTNGTLNFPSDFGKTVQRSDVCRIAARGLII